MRYTVFYQASMLLLIVFCSVFSFTLAEQKASDRDIYWILESDVRKSLGGCDAHNVYPRQFESIGIWTNRTYPVSNFKNFDETYSLITQHLQPYVSEYPQFTLKHLLQLAKEDIPELEYEIDHLFAIAVKGLIVYSDALYYGFKLYYSCLHAETCKNQEFITIAGKDNIEEFLNGLRTKVNDSFQNLEKETLHSIQSTIEYFDSRSEIIHFEFNSHRMGKFLVEWIENCTNNKEYEEQQLDLATPAESPNN